MPISTVLQQLKNTNLNVPLNTTKNVNINLDESDRNNDDIKSELQDIKRTISTHLFYTNENIIKLNSNVNNLVQNELYDDVDTKVRLNEIENAIVNPQTASSQFSMANVLGVTAGGIGLAAIVSQFVDIKDVFNKIGESLSNIIGSFSNLNISELITDLFSSIKTKLETFDLSEFTKSLKQQFENFKFSDLFNGLLEGLGGLIKGISGVDFSEAFGNLEKQIKEFKFSQLFGSMSDNIQKFVKDLIGLDVKEIAKQINAGIAEFRIGLLSAKQGIKQFSVDISNSTTELLKKFEPLVKGLSIIGDHFSHILGGLEVMVNWIRNIINVIPEEYRKKIGDFFNTQETAPFTTEAEKFKETLEFNQRITNDINVADQEILNRQKNIITLQQKRNETNDTEEQKKIDQDISKNEKEIAEFTSRKEKLSGYKTEYENVQKLREAGEPALESPELIEYQRTIKEKDDNTEEEEEDTDEPILRETASSYKTSGGKLTKDTRSVSEKEWEGIDPRLKRIMRLAAEKSGYDIVITSGKEARGTRTANHPAGRAVDIRLIDPSGKVLSTEPNVSSPRNITMASKYFREYEKVGQIAKQIADQEGVPFRWGGYFGNNNGKYDITHFDIGTGAMGAGSWKTGLYESAKRNLYGGKVKSQGMGNVPIITARNENFIEEEEEEEQINSNLPPNITKAMRFFMGKGLSSKDAAAIVANLMAEGGLLGNGDLNPNKSSSDGKHSYGIAQWRLTRLDELKKRPNYQSIDTQLEFLWDELTGKTPDKSYANVLEGMSQQNSLSSKTRYFTNNFERPQKGLEHFATRERFARKLLNESDGVSKPNKPSVLERVFGTGGLVRTAMASDAAQNFIPKNLQEYFAETMNNFSGFFDNILPDNYKDTFKSALAKIGDVSKETISGDNISELLKALMGNAETNVQGSQLVANIKKLPKSIGNVIEFGKMFVNDEDFRKTQTEGFYGLSKDEQTLNDLLKNEKTKGEIINLIKNNPKNTIKVLSDYLIAHGIKEENVLEFANKIHSSISNITTNKGISEGIDKFIQQQDQESKGSLKENIKQLLGQPKKSIGNVIEFGKMFINDEAFRKTQTEGFYGLSKDEQTLNDLLKNEKTKGEIINLIKNNPKNTINVLSDYLKSHGIDEKNVLELANKIHASISNITTTEGIAEGINKFVDLQEQENKGSLKDTFKQLLGYDIGKLENLSTNNLAEIMNNPSMILSENIASNDGKNINIINSSNQPQVIPVQRQQTVGTPTIINHEVPAVRDSTFMAMIFDDFYPAAEHLQH